MGSWMGDGEAPFELSARLYLPFQAPAGVFNIGMKRLGLSILVLLK